ncbi:MAG: NfeD family protein [Planctomycetota bacterium]
MVSGLTPAVSSVCGVAPCGWALAQAVTPTGPAAAPPDQALLLWGVLLFGVTLALVLVEVFVPTGGIVGAVASVVSIAAVICLFGYSTTAGFIGLTLLLIAGPVVLLYGLKIAPNTPFVKLLSLRDGQVADPTHPAEPDQTPEHALLGKPGQALSDLHPVGVCRIEGQRIDCLSVSGAIAKGAAVEVVGHDGMQAKVKKV